MIRNDLSMIRYYNRRNTGRFSPVSVNIFLLVSLYLQFLILLNYLSIFSFDFSRSRGLNHFNAHLTCETFGNSTRGTYSTIIHVDIAFITKGLKKIFKISRFFLVNKSICSHTSMEFYSCSSLFNYYNYTCMVSIIST